MYPPAENSRMKNVLNGVAIAAALAITAPALAQAQTSGAPPQGSAAAPATGAHTAGHATAARVHRPQRPTHARGTTSRSVASASRSAGASPTDNVANQLNGQELQRRDASSAPAAMPMPPRSVARPQPGLSTSSGTYTPPSPGGRVSSASPAEEGPRISGGGNIAAPTGPMPIPSSTPTGARPSGH